MIDGIILLMDSQTLQVHTDWALLNSLAPSQFNQLRIQTHALGVSSLLQFYVLMNTADDVKGFFQVSVEMF